MSLTQSLISHLRTFPACPYLFVGSGLSRRYLGTETWDGLLRRFAAGLEFDYSYFLSRGASQMPKVAALIAESFHKSWYSDARFQDLRVAHDKTVRDISSPLRIAISEYLKTRELDMGGISPSLSQEIALLRNATVDGVITTNWDRLMEAVFPDYKPYVGQDSLIFHPITGIGEIYKIHGCCSAPQSLVLTDDDYRRFEGKNPYLAAKLTTIFVEHPVVFLGYSGADSNIRKILGALTHCLGAENIDRLRDRLIFVEWSAGAPGSMQPSEITVMEPDSSVIIPITKVRVDDFSPVFEALSGRRRIPARILRQLKEQVYELVLRNDPNEQIYVKDLDGDREPSEIQIVYGVGVAPAAAPTPVGYRGLDRQALVFDVVYNDGETVQGKVFRKHPLDSSRVIKEVLPDLLKTTPWVPVHKYLKEFGLGLQDLDGADWLDGRVKKATRHEWKNVSKFYRVMTEKKGYTSIAHILEDLGPGGFSKARYYIPHLGLERISPDELLHYIKAWYEKNDWRDDTLTRIMVCLYDYIVYGRQSNV